MRWKIAVVAAFLLGTLATSAGVPGGLTPEEVKACQEGLSSSTQQKLLAAFRERLLSSCLAEGRCPEPLKGFLGRHRDLADKLVTAISPGVDDPAGVLRVLEELRVGDEAAVTKYQDLAIALAVVHDVPGPAHLWGLGKKGEVSLVPAPARELFDYYTVSLPKGHDYYTGRESTRNFLLPLEQVPWPFLVPLAENNLGREERAWAWNRFNARASGVSAVKSLLTTLYREVKYDDDKLLGKPRLGERPYTLENVLQYGGICVDQAYVVSRVAQCLGVPAWIVGSEDTPQLVGHAWAAFLLPEGGKRWARSEAGRYEGNNYYTGQFFDPQPGEKVPDWQLEMRLVGVSRSLEDYSAARLLARLAAMEQREHPKASLALAKRALELNAYCLEGWQLLMGHVRAGTADKESGLQWFNLMLDRLQDRPEVTLECFLVFVDCLPGQEVKGRQALYRQVYPRFARRLDLQLRLRWAQAGELREAGMKKEALALLLDTVGEKAHEGGHMVFPLAQEAVTLALELKLAAETDRALREAEKKLPYQKRMTANQPDLKELFRKLREPLLK